MTEDARNKRLADFSPEDVAMGRVVRAAAAEGLERQRGRAAGAFRTALQDPAFRMVASAPQTPIPMVMKLWAGSSSAIAACLAVVLTAQFLLRPTQPATIETQTASPMVVNQVMYTRNIDGGTVMLDENTPARIVKQQKLRQTEWFDQKEKATYSVTQPIETVQYQKINPY